jgi:hypothetical protein
MAIISIFLVLLAGVARFAAMFVFIVVLFALPIAYAFRGLKALWTALGMILVYIFIKVVIVLIIWAGFMVLEGVALEQLLSYNDIDQEIQTLLTEADPGFIYTPAGVDIVMKAQQSSKAGVALGSLTMSLVVFMVVMVAMIFIAFKIPAMLSAIFGIQSLAEDSITGSLFIGASAVTFGTAAIAKVGDLFKGGSEENNRIDPG